MPALWADMPRLNARARLKILDVDGPGVTTIDAIPVRVLEPDGFYPINYWNIWELIEARRVPPDCCSIHLWNSRWRKERLDPNAVYSPACIYEQLKRRFGVGSPQGAPRGPGWPSFARHWWRQLKSSRRRAA